MGDEVACLPGFTMKKKRKHSSRTLREGDIRKTPDYGKLVREMKERRSRIDAEFMKIRETGLRPKPS